MVFATGYRLAIVQLSHTSHPLKRVSFRLLFLTRELRNQAKIPLVQL